ncbi:hypothetical protein [Companilactobacillus hulinensis]|uniref:hypothetical protein n=1 Tax=Companilactobacillus hulinensis TaxID=2486007 RepID=UPI000F7A04DC|nr:hypothetical protein [Companilactobacillus hulinensis]
MKKSIVLLFLSTSLAGFWAVPSINTVEAASTQNNSGINITLTKDTSKNGYVEFGDNNTVINSTPGLIKSASNLRYYEALPSNGSFVSYPLTYPADAAWGTKGSYAKINYNLGGSGVKVWVGNNVRTARSHNGFADAKVYGSWDYTARSSYWLS